MLEALVQLAVLALYISALCYGFVVHEPWFDEAQSWLLARDAGLVELLATRLRFEGHPPLWYMLLGVFARADFPYSTQQFVAGAVGVAGSILVFQCSAVPLALRATLPLGYFFVYQYTIVARSYVLFLPLFALLARSWNERRERPVLMALLLSLIAQTSVHGAAVALLLALLVASELISRWRLLPRSVRRKSLIAGGILASNAAALVAMLAPPSNLAISSKLGANFHAVELAQLVARSLANVTFGSSVLSLATLVVLAHWLWIRRSLLTTLCALVGVSLVAAIYHNIWHEGLFFLALCFGIFCAYQQGEPPRIASRAHSLAVTLLILCVFLQHVLWSVRALRADRDLAYSGSQAAAHYIREHGIHEKRLFGSGFPAIALQPYFPRNIFTNYVSEGGFAFWDWSTEAPWLYKPKTQLRFEDIVNWNARLLAPEPDYLLLTMKFPSDRLILEGVQQSGAYEIEAVFPGQLAWKGRSIEPETFVLLRRVP